MGSGLACNVCCESIAQSSGVSWSGIVDCSGGIVLVDGECSSGGYNINDLSGRKVKGHPRRKEERKCYHSLPVFLVTDEGS